MLSFIFIYFLCIATINFDILSGETLSDRLQYPRVFEQQRLNSLHGATVHDFLSVAQVPTNRVQKLLIAGSRARLLCGARSIPLTH